MVALAIAMLTAAPLSTASASQIQARPETLMRTSSWEKLRDLLKEEFRRTGGHLEQWPDSTIDQAPMRFVQAVYVQMGGDPTKLNLTKTPLLLEDVLLLQMYVAVGGTDDTDTLIDELFDTRIQLLWEFFVFLGGEATAENQPPLQSTP